MCDCNRRRANVAAATQALARGDVKAAAGEIKDFTASAAADLKQLLDGKPQKPPAA